jgi:hypothetical protein
VATFFAGLNEIDLLQKETDSLGNLSDFSMMPRPVRTDLNCDEPKNRWYLTSKSEYQAAGAGIGAAWKETLGKNFPPSTLLYIDGLVDERAKVEIEVTAFVPAA